jgi:polyisoprenyl-phosphate glycosyltransferase
MASNQIALSAIFRRLVEGIHAQLNLNLVWSARLGPWFATEIALCGPQLLTECAPASMEVASDSLVNGLMTANDRDLRAKEVETLQAHADEFENTPVLSIVVPVYNEVDVLSEFHNRLTRVLDALRLRSEVIYVNDGSGDLSLQMLESLGATDCRVAILNLSRNFGKEIALTAGLDHARGDAAIVIDADLQDPPELIPSLVDAWREGFDVVYATRRERRGESWLKRTTANLFYRLMHNIGDVPIPEGTGDFRLLNRRSLDALMSCRERRRFMKGLFAWVGFSQTAILYDRAPRFAGKTKWNYWRLWNFAIEGITSFTIAPLKLSMYFGLVTALLALGYGTYIICRTLVLGREMPGYASLMVAILFLAGVQLIAMGVIGEYVGRIFVESKGRPLYLVDGYFNSHIYGPRIGTKSDPMAAHTYRAARNVAFQNRHTRSINAPAPSRN